MNCKRIFPLNFKYILATIQQQMNGHDDLRGNAREHLLELEEEAHERALEDLDALLRRHSGRRSAGQRRALLIEERA